MGEVLRHRAQLELFQGLCEAIAAACDQSVSSKSRAMFISLEDATRLGPEGTTLGQRGRCDSTMKQVHFTSMPREAAAISVTHGWDELLAKRYDLGLSDAGRCVLTHQRKYDSAGRRKWQEQLNWI